MECFKQGLKPEIEQRLENALKMELVVQNAMKAERLVEARKVLRKETRSKSEVFSQNKDFKIGTYVSQAFKVEEDTNVTSCDH